MIHRIVALAFLLGAEVLIASFAFDGEKLASAPGPALALLGRWGAWAGRWALGTVAISALFAVLKRPGVPDYLLGRFLRPFWLAGHTISLAAFGAMSGSIYGGRIASGPTVVLWAASALAVAATAALSFLPLTALGALWRHAGRLWILAAAASGLACWLGALFREVWQPVTANTFAMVRFLLSIAVPDPDLIVQADALRVGTPRFTVVVSPECSGLEGIGLVLTFGALWLIVFREELRFPNALALLPAGAAAVYLLNAVRIAALVLIGDAGWEDVALRGFHSQAGWISFTGVTLGLLLAARGLPWIAAGARTRKSADTQAVAQYPAAPYLVPFLAIMGAGIVSGAMTANFEWMYFLRSAACLSALWMFRHRYRGVDWKCGWLAPAAGIAVFGIWIAADRWMAPSHAAGMPAQLAGASYAVQLAWLGARVIGAVVAIPIAEELAFRGFGMRRLVDDDFENVPWRSFTWLSIGGSAAVFGILHGGLWLAGIAAGLVYGFVMVRRGRLGESIGAHATTNALLAVYVLATGRWDLW
ncbi:MAG: exosortase E/protease, VPEID-CTERM system [Bryobacteraceae bacterium]